MAHENATFEMVYHLARLALSGRRQDVLAQIQRLSRRLKTLEPDIASKLLDLLMEQPTRLTPVRSTTIDAVPVEADSRLQMVRSEHQVQLDIEPIWDEAVRRPLSQIVLERTREVDLRDAGLFPTKSVLFTGPPGVGKTLAARWLSRELGRPLLTLDLAAVMSSLLGRTGGNIRQVLDYAKGTNCVLLLDELDAVAKRRDDSTDIGELKRLVTVLLQEIDDWPPSGVLVAATNHPDLLDPAIWRRFEVIVDFPMPDDEQVRQVIFALSGMETSTSKVIDAAVVAYRGQSFAEIERDLLKVRREAVLHRLPIAESLLNSLTVRANSLKHAEKVRLAVALVDAGLSQRKASDLTKIHRNTIKNAVEAPESTP